MNRDNVAIILGVLANIALIALYFLEVYYFSKL